MNNTEGYIHGASTAEEKNRLDHQAEGSGRFLWRGLDLKGLVGDNADKPFIEVGSGVGSQTLQLISRLPEQTPLICMDIDAMQIEQAKTSLSNHPSFGQRLSFVVEDATKATWKQNSLSGAYVCWVLEHLTPASGRTLLSSLCDAIQPQGFVLVNDIVMAPGSGMTVLDAEGQFPPEIKAFLEAMVSYQAKLGGNANFGEEKTMLNAFAGLPFKSVSFRRIVMEYPESELPNSRAVTLEMFGGIKDTLIEEGLFSAARYQTLVEEVKSAVWFSWSSGQVLAIV